MYRFHLHRVVARRRQFRESRCQRKNAFSAPDTRLISNPRPGLRVAPGPFSYRHGANYRSYKPSSISRRTQPGPRDAYSTDPLGQSPRCDNNQRNKPTYDQQGYTSPVRAASVSRATCPLNIHEPPPCASSDGASETDDRVKCSEGGERERKKYVDSIDLSLESYGASMEMCFDVVRLESRSL